MIDVTKESDRQLVEPADPGPTRMANVVALAEKQRIVIVVVAVYAMHSTLASPFGRACGILVSAPARVAQRIERHRPKVGVGGSSPSAGADDRLYPVSFPGLPLTMAVVPLSYPVPAARPADATPDPSR